MFKCAALASVYDVIGSSGFSKDAELNFVTMIYEGYVQKK
jgi:hypothetical protein